ncbi:MAG: relaxase MobL, partial [Oscillospiraceae bacterium]
MLNYIATRDGVELNNMVINDDLKNIENQLDLEDEDLGELANEIKFLQNLDSENYVKYIATRKGVDTGENKHHGLFGRLSSMSCMDDIEDLEKTRRYVEKLAYQKKTIYNAVISMKEDDAQYKEMISKENWGEFVNANINDIARGMNINPRTMEWVGAVHLEKGHPHIHLMYWDTAQTIGVNFIKPEQSNKIRFKLINNMYRDELSVIRTNKDEKSKAILEKVFTSDNSILKNELNVYKNMSLEDIKRIVDNETFKSK